MNRLFLFMFSLFVVSPVFSQGKGSGAPSSVLGLSEWAKLSENKGIELHFRYGHFANANPTHSAIQLKMINRAGKVFERIGVNLILHCNNGKDIDEGSLTLGYNVKVGEDTGPTYSNGYACQGQGGLRTFTATPALMKAKNGSLSASSNGHLNGNIGSSKIYSQQSGQRNNSNTNTDHLNSSEARTNTKYQSEIKKQQSGDLELAEAYCWRWRGTGSNTSEYYSCNGPVQFLQTSEPNVERALDLVGCDDPAPQSPMGWGKSSGSWYLCNGRQLRSYDNSPSRIRESLNTN